MISDLRREIERFEELLAAQDVHGLRMRFRDVLFEAAQARATVDGLSALLRDQIDRVGQHDAKEAG